MKNNINKMITNFKIFLNESRDNDDYMDAQRMLVINKILDEGKFDKIRKSLMTKLTGPYSIGMLTDEEQELYYFLLRGKKQSKQERDSVYSG